jgi:hypothetical protein
MNVNWLNVSSFIVHSIHVVVWWFVFLASGFAVNRNNAQLDPDAEENISKTSKLSVNAKEFYPPNYTSQQPEGSCSSFQFEEVRRPCM